MLQRNQNADDFSKKKISQLQHSTILCFLSIECFIHLTIKSKFPFYNIMFCLYVLKKIIIKFLEFEKASKHALAGAQ